MKTINIAEAQAEHTIRGLEKHRAMLNDELAQARAECEAAMSARRCRCAFPQRHRHSFT
jgi:hypothetical protein